MPPRDHYIQTFCADRSSGGTSTADALKLVLANQLVMLTSLHTIMANDVAANHGLARETSPLTLSLIRDQIQATRAELKG